MKKRLIAAAATAMLAVNLIGTSVYAEVDSNEGLEIKENSESVTGYTINFTYTDPEATDVNLLGGFQFYETGDINVYANGFVLPANDSQANHLIGPNEWMPGAGLRHLNDTGSTIPMEKDENGVWKTSLNLPGGCYLYQYSVSYDGGETFESIADPENIPVCNTQLGASQTRSQFFVPYDEKQGEEEYYDWGWVTPIEDEAQRGEISTFTYDGLDGEQRGEIYLPANYDKDRETPYKVLYLSHGGGGDEADWFYQGNAGNILDRLIAEGASEEFVTVCMNNTVYVDKFSADENDKSYSSNNDYFLYCYDNIKDYLIPYVEENYNVSSEASEKAFAGLSNGAKLTDQIFINDPSAFGYYGLFSGSSAWAWPELEDYSQYTNANIYLAAGWADQLMMQNTYHTDGDKTLMGAKEQLDAAGIMYNNGERYVTVEGAHDWFTWPQIFRDYVSNTLWK
ncbi:MAG: alpha/beta hydrolase-fold protein [Eubacteriales bacterium]|nr:alpha/beta hydrolase-fold protein [Eubacteriales bacterium]